LTGHRAGNLVVHDDLLELLEAHHDRFRVVDFLKGHATHSANVSFNTRLLEGGDGDGGQVDGKVALNHMEVSNVLLKLNNLGFL
jgi:hypothetical protein